MAFLFSNLFTFGHNLFTFCRNRLSDVASGAKSIVNRMGRGIAGVGKAGRDSVARNDNGIADSL